RAWPESLISDETDQLMETGGGVRRALGLLERGAFLVVNSDNVWLGEDVLRPLIGRWRPGMMEALLLLTPRENALGYTRAGDFDLGDSGRLVRRGDRDGAPYVYTGAQIITAAAMKRGPRRDPFSMNLIWDELIAKGQAFGVIHRGGWVDVGTPEGLELAREAVAAERPRR
ncbi:MAG: nucleotidyltransferase family protein, partial [Pseudomonadota bacterium]